MSGKAAPCAEGSYGNATGRESQANAAPSTLPKREFAQSVADPTNADGSARADVVP